MSKTSWAELGQAQLQLELGFTLLHYFDDYLTILLFWPYFCWEYYSFFVQVNFYFWKGGAGLKNVWSRRLCGDTCSPPSTPHCQGSPK